MHNLLDSHFWKKSSSLIVRSPQGGGSRMYECTHTCHCLPRRGTLLLFTHPMKPKSTSSPQGGPIVLSSRGRETSWTHLLGVSIVRVSSLVSYSTVRAFASGMNTNSGTWTHMDIIHSILSTAWLPITAYLQWNVKHKYMYLIIL